MEEKDFIQYVNIMMNSIRGKINDEENDFFDLVVKSFNEKCECVVKAIEILGQYKHYSVPTEKQNKRNEDIVDNAYSLLKGDLNGKDD